MLLLMVFSCFLDRVDQK